MDKVRIQRVLSDAGVTSRRGVEQMILDGRIEVNRQIVIHLPCFVDPEKDEVRVDGQKVRTKAEKLTYWLLNKPRGVVCTENDPAGRPRVTDLLAQVQQRIFPVGRLDIEDTGLIILTNDGELTKYLTHPRYGVIKTYVAEVDGYVEGELLTRLRQGIYLDGGRARIEHAKILDRSKTWSALEIKMTEGRNRQARRMLARLGHKVLRLKRIAIGPITDRGLKIGKSRPLTAAEVERLRSCGGMPANTGTGRRNRRHGGE